LDQVLKTLVDLATEILQVDKSSLLIWDERGERLVVHTSHGYKSDSLEGMSYAPEEGAIGTVAASGEPIVVEDTQHDERVDKRIVEAEHIRSSMHFPIKIGGQVFGVFNADYCQPRGFGEDEQRLFTALAQRAASAIQNAQLYEQAQELAVVEERSRLARDLHDAVTQTLFSSSLIAEVLPRIWERDSEEGQRRLAELQELTRGALAEMRTLLLELRPTALDEADLGELLRQLADSITGRARVPVALDVAGECDPPSNIKIALYRIAQEALNNIAKHAGANNVTVELSCQTGLVKLQITDDGQGFNMGEVTAENLGLRIMRERAEAIDAQLDIQSQIGQGTTIKVNWTNQSI
jgi:two-component system nitrate/nitrite sensor histidine kinase NarX